MTISEIEYKVIATSFGQSILNFVKVTIYYSMFLKNQLEWIKIVDVMLI